MESAIIVGVVVMTVLSVAYYLKFTLEAGARERAAGARLQESRTGAAGSESLERRARVFAGTPEQGGLRGWADELIAQAGFRFSSHLLFALCGGLWCAGFALGALRLDWAAAAVVGPAPAVGPVIYLRACRQRRLKSLSAALPYVLDMLRSALGAGHTLQRALQMAAQRNRDTLGDELRIVIDQVRLGMSLPGALESMYRRAPLEELGFLASAVALQEQTGSNLGEVLERVSTSLRNRQRLEDQIRSLTSQSRSGAIIVAALPVVVLTAFSLIRADYARVLFTDPTGQRLLETAIGLDAIAFWLMRRIARVDY